MTEIYKKNNFQQLSITNTGVNLTSKERVKAKSLAENHRKFVKIGYENKSRTFDKTNVTQLQKLSIW